MSARQQRQSRIIDLFHSPGVARDQVMLMAFPFTLKGKAKQWMKRLSVGSITTWKLFKQAFLDEYRPPLKIIKQIESIRNFKQKLNEPLHCSWERFTKSLFSCPEHKLNEHEQLRIFYQGLEAERDYGPMIDRDEFLSLHLSLCRCVDRHVSENVRREWNLSRNYPRILSHEVRMAQHKYETPMEGRISNLEETLNNFIKESRIRQKESENIVWGIKKTYDQTFKTQASSIKKIEIHLGRITKIIQDRETDSLPSSTENNPKGLANAITTRSRLNYKPLKNPLENITTSQEKLATKETTIKSGEKGPDNPRKSMKSYDHSIPFPRRLKKEKEKEQFRKFFENLQQLSINIPFFEALEQMPKYAKFMKDLLARKGKTEETSKITLNERSSAVLLNKIPFKEKDPGSFTIPCVIGKMGIDKALADLGANISLMPYSMGIAENVIVKIDKFIFPVDFVVLDMKEDHKILIILGRPFLATTHAMIDVFNKKISFKVGNETIMFDIEKSMKFSTPEDDECLSIDMVDKVVSNLVHEILPSSPLD
ncbi:hypothetical protein Tco_0787814 [Tanacetum coccineum]